MCVKTIKTIKKIARMHGQACAAAAPCGGIPGVGQARAAGEKKEIKMKSEKLSQQIIEKIHGIENDGTIVNASFKIIDSSVKAELRLSATWTIRRPVDEIQYPKDLSGNAGELWNSMSALAGEITKTSKLLEGKNAATIKINKNGQAEAKNQFIIAAGRQFLADYKKTASKSAIKLIDKKIADLQAQQKALLPAIRKCNSEFCAERKNAKIEQGKINAAALSSGRFWEADDTAIKQYFRPQFAKNYLADVSKKWRAALFLECVEISYKGYNSSCHHKLHGTGRGYLCGIDDNGDDWGFIVNNLSQSYDDYSNAALDFTVEDAMSNVFSIDKTDLDKCTRQGDLLFCPVKTKTEDSPEPFLTSADQWEPRAAHLITSPTLQHNSVYFCADNDIIVQHTSHAAVILPAGDYQLYMSADAD